MIASKMQSLGRKRCSSIFEATPSNRRIRRHLTYTWTRCSVPILDDRSREASLPKTSSGFSRRGDTAVPGSLLIIPRISTCKVVTRGLSFQELIFSP
ncbi:hypothetical protein AG1IA_08120 [Rhizoctonia solani AG-1 IA]|uniref:Uncharacterized protein n=1 Tax=Thanatephorus cucumeris (strain AG1-IA) TaxID=983506 RepID=L8WIW8_THACA|nr:hypothetical protein AG1IA_08120 [Rhizoctonia solani AG-1 IA]